MFSSLSRAAKAGRPCPIIAAPATPASPILNFLRESFIEFPPIHPDFDRSLRILPCSLCRLQGALLDMDQPRFDKRAANGDLTEREGTAAGGALRCRAKLVWLANFRVQ